MAASWQVEATVHSPKPMKGDPSAYSGSDSFTFVRLRLRDLDGVEGNGFSGRFLAPEVAHFLNRALPEILAEGVEDPVTVMAHRFNPRNMGGVVISALSALEIALTDLRAKRAGQSVAAHLGGARAAAPFHVTCGFPELSTEVLAEVCRKEVASGALGVKVLVAARGRSVAEDLARLQAVRQAIGEEAELIADANCRMDLEAALRFVDGARHLNLAWLEEPVIGNDIAALSRLAAEGIPIGAGQMEQSAARFEAFSEAGVKMIQPNAVFLGGFKAAIDAAQDAVDRRISISMAGGWEIVNLHWICGAFTTGAVELHRAQVRIVRLLMADPPMLSAGKIAVPNRPGLGLEPNERLLRECRIG
ncbi:enolase C-terminal domain-like protein [Actibacterium pelagium]|uniref:Mandelate racemase n=1 Tax=Actibacterium pelagium TaxID=2029103 RepID=A0A917AEI3_9RHOB|nr:enolase C-terminal domain-like protein [Actibacterium pelagium]GGE45544.1 mandelate racemase [Actibacterium pelagium]